MALSTKRENVFMHACLLQDILGDRCEFYICMFKQSVRNFQLMCQQDPHFFLLILSRDLARIHIIAFISFGEGISPNIARSLPRLILYITATVVAHIKIISNIV